MTADRRVVGPLGVRADSSAFLYSQCLCDVDLKKPGFCERIHEITPRWDLGIGAGSRIALTHPNADACEGWRRTKGNPRSRDHVTLRSE